MELDNALDQLGVFPGAPAGVGLPLAETSNASQSGRMGCSAFIASIR
jgi:hypothetical protein